MKVGVAYCVVVLIWSTTPLAIKWSNSSLSFVTAISARVLLAFVICAGIMLFLRRPLIEKRSDWKAFTAALIGAFPNMLLVYWSAQHIPSGLAAVIFGLYPFMVGFFSLLILKENIFNFRRIVALCVALIGLAVINVGQISVGGNAVLGALGMVMSTVFFGLSSVLLKKTGSNIEPLRLTTGSLLLAAPLYILSWWYFDGVLPDTIDMRSLSGVVYLAISGTVIGSCLFFYVLRHCQISTVGLITFITPVIAVVIGHLVDKEKLTVMTLLGCSLVILSLAVYQNVFQQVQALFHVCERKVKSRRDELKLLLR